MKLQELVAAPISLTLETVIDGTKFYSSDNLKKKFILAFEKSSKGKHITKEMEVLVQDRKLVLPCYKSKNLFGFIKRKLTGGPEKYILGFYHIEKKKVVVLIENSMTIFGTAANNELVSTTMHECMHLVAGKNLNKFKSVFIRYLQSYYTEFIKEYLQVENVPKKEIDNLIKYISVLEKRGAGFANKDLGNYYRLLLSSFKSSSSLEGMEFEERIRDLVVAIKLFVMHMPTLIRNARKYAMLFTSLNRAYFNAFGKRNTYTTPIQELISLSEIACVLSEMEPQAPVIRKLFNIIA